MIRKQTSNTSISCCNYHSKVCSKQAQDFLQELLRLLAYRLPVKVQGWVPRESSSSEIYWKQFNSRKQ